MQFVERPRDEVLIMKLAVTDNDDVRRRWPFNGIFGDDLQRRRKNVVLEPFALDLMLGKVIIGA
jgi:hypothetical protein